MRQENRVDPARTALQPKPLMAVLHGEVPAVPPMWLMRQAGRYLPEYRALRAQKGGFLELVYDSEAAAEVTLQPLRRFGFDGAILFSDILIVPYAMGQDLWFEAGEGPRLAPILGDTDLSALTPDFSRFDAVYETVRLVKAALDPAVTFLGFAGSPWTVATYMVAGQGSKDHAAARRMAACRARGNAASNSGSRGISARVNSTYAMAFHGTTSANGCSSVPPLCGSSLQRTLTTSGTQP